LTGPRLEYSSTQTARSPLLTTRPQGKECTASCA
jgi:hypothetical protein